MESIQDQIFYIPGESSDWKMLTDKYDVIASDSEEKFKNQHPHELDVKGISEIAARNLQYISFQNKVGFEPRQRSEILSELEDNFSKKNNFGLPVGWENALGANKNDSCKSVECEIISDLFLLKNTVISVSAKFNMRPEKVRKIAGEFRK